jgi:hypothetical protein
MTKTERAFWMNGYQARGSHKSIAFSIGSFAVLISNNPTIKLYKLT